MTHPQRYWLHLHFPQLALEARFGEAAHHQPALLTESDGRTLRLCNTLAADQGVQPGMTLRTAYCLVDRVVQASYSPSLEADQLHRLAVLCYRHCASIRLCPPVGLCLEIGSMLNWHGGLDPLLDALQTELDQSGHDYQLALGHTPLNARLLAENGLSWRRLERAEEQRLLARLTVQQLALPLEPAEVRALAAMGLKDLERLRRAPRAELGYRFGRGLIDYLAALEQPRDSGELFQLPARFDEHLELWHEVDSAEQLIFPIRRLLHNLEAYLGARQRLASELTLRLEHREAPPSHIQLALNRAAQRAEHWQTLVALALERQRLPAAVLVIRLQAEGLADNSGESGDLLGDNQPRADADRLLTLLTSKLGPAGVRQPAAGPDWRPVRASRLRPAGRSQAVHARAQPTLLLTRPEAIDPADYELLAGPERLALPAWTEPEGFQRDYYRAWHRTGRCCHWISRHRNGDWYCEGLFA